MLMMMCMREVKITNAPMLSQILEALHSLTQDLAVVTQGQSSLTTQLSILHSTRTTLASQHSHLSENLVSRPMSSRMTRSAAAFSNPPGSELANG